MKKVSDVNLNELKQRGELTIVKFWAGWCQPCKMLEPIIEEAEEKFPDVNFVSVDTENADNSEIVKEYLIMSIPVIAFLKNGEQVEKMVGVPLKKKFLDTIEQYV